MSVYLASGIALGVILILVHAWIAFREKATPDLPSAVSIFLGSTGIGSGVKLFVVSVTADDLHKPFSNDDRVYIILGAIALVWVSLLYTFRGVVSQRSDDDG